MGVESAVLLGLPGQEARRWAQGWQAARSWEAKGGALSVFCGGGKGGLLGESVRYQELGNEEPVGGGLRGGFKGSLFVLEVIAGLAVESGAFVARVLFVLEVIAGLAVDCLSGAFMARVLQPPCMLGAPVHVGCPRQSQPGHARQVE